MSVGHGLHRRQFVIGARPVQPDGDWQTETVPGVGILSYSRALPVALENGPGGEFRALLGHAVSNVAGESVSGNLRNCSPEELVRRTSAWTGRWALVAGQTLIPDAGSLLGIYSARDRGTPIVSSSPALLAECLDERPAPVERSLVRLSGIDWFPPPGSGLEGVRRVLPSEVLDLATGQATTIRSLTPRPEKYEDLLERLEERLIRVIQNAAKGHRRICLPLTGGYDSRLLLAICHAAKLEPILITQRKQIMSREDREIPPLLAMRTGLEHRWIETGDASEERRAAYDRHTARHTVDIDREYFARGQLDWAEEGDLILRGGAFEVGRCYYWKSLAAEDTTAKAIGRALGEQDPGKPWPGLIEWCERFRHASGEGVDWRDRFYWEQRVAGWLSAIEQSLDLIPGTRFHLANSIDTYSDLLEVPEAHRRSSQHHRDLIRRLAPELDELPYRLAPRLRTRIRSRVGRLLRRLGLR